MNFESSLYLTKHKEIKSFNSFLYLLKFRKLDNKSCFFNMIIKLFFKTFNLFL